MGAAADKIGTQRAFVVPLIGAVSASAYPVWLNVAQKDGLDGHKAQDERKVTEEERGQVEHAGSSQQDSEIARIREGFDVFCEVKSRSTEVR